MAYNTNNFETAALSVGVVLESIHKENNTVSKATGTITVGNHVRSVYWNADGECYSYRRKRLEKWDLPLKTT